METKKILVLGAKGMLGQELVRVFGADGSHGVVGWDAEDADVTDFAVAERKIREEAPTVILNAVAYNAVDRCEESDEEYRKAMSLNAEAPGFLARLARDLGATIVHYSSDYVFDGEREDGYAEDATPHPLSKYGESKRGGEKNVMAEGGNFYVIRLSKLFGKPATSAQGKRSFFEKMLEVARLAENDKSRQAQGKAEVSAVDDERSCFTYAPDLAQATLDLIKDGAAPGIYHLANTGAVTWYEAAQKLYELAGVKVAVKPVSAGAFPRPARRPHMSELLNTKRPALRPYTEALEEFLKQEKP